LVETGMRVLPYMDDFLGLCDSRESALTARAYTEAVLERLGLSRNVDKGQWEPVQRTEHLKVPPTGRHRHCVRPVLCPP
jgi:hypothetical protein